MEDKEFEVIIIGAGGAGLFCGIEAAKRSRRVLVIDHAMKIGGKILISGGGRCNFTNKNPTYKNYVSNNPHFCKSALSRYTSADFVSLVEKHGISYHEKKLGQLFCDISAKEIVQMLEKECKEAGVKILLNTYAKNIKKIEDHGFSLSLHNEHYSCESLVVATGGLSLPKLGATGIGYEIAKKFGHTLVECAPALDGFVLKDTEFLPFQKLAGISLECIMTVNNISFRENILFTHSGLSGPAALQTSLHWKEGDPIHLNLIPDFDFEGWLISKKNNFDKSLLKNSLIDKFPLRFIELFLSHYFPSLLEKTLPHLTLKEIHLLSNKLKKWTLVPVSTIGYSKAEVTRGGVNTDEVSSKTFESKKVKGLYFVGEVLDVTGWLGGYNFQWAWSSGWAAGQEV